MAQVFLAKLAHTGHWSRDSRTRRRDGQLPAAAVAAQRRAINVAVDGGRFKERPDLNDPSADFKDYSIGLKDFTKGTKNAPADQYPTDHIPDLIMSEYFDQKYGKVARPTADCICRCGEVMLYLLRPLLMCV